MCGIIGIFNCEKSLEQIIKGLEKIRHRGKDSFGISDGKKVIHANNIQELSATEFKGNKLIAHNLHSIIGFVEQPLKGEGTIVVNGEIYNWKELCDEYCLKATNDTEALLKLIEKKKVRNAKQMHELLQEVRGVYAFAYLKGEKLILARDIIGIKPMWLAEKEKELAFVSERKALITSGFKQEETRELHPRHVLAFDLTNGNKEDYYRGFFNYKKKEKYGFEEAKKKIRELVEESVKIRIPEEPFGLLFSGGLDSTLIAGIAKETNHDFVCYTAATSEKAKDLVYAKKVAEKMGLKLKYKIVKQEDVEDYLKKVIPMIEDASVVKAAVSLPIYVACELAKKDGIKVILAGNGSDEIFCGYERHSHGLDLVKESYYELLRFFERNGYRDDVLAMNNSLELRLPYLDRKLVEAALKLPDEFKINDAESKHILRRIALEKGIPEEAALRKKTAAQYGSGFDNAIEKIARKKRMKKADYIKNFLKQPNLRLGSLMSTGKDSIFAIHLMNQQNYEINCAITIKSEEKDSYMFHTPTIELAKAQAEALGIPLVEVTTKGEKEKELTDLKKAIRKAVEEYHIEGISSGAIHSNYQRERIEKICDELGIKSFSPLWHSDEESILKAMVKQGFRIMIVKTAAAGMEGFAGKGIDEKVISELIKVKEKYKISIVGEGGEFETLVLDAPMFTKRIELEDYEIKEKGSVSEIIIKKFKLVNK